LATITEIAVAKIRAVETSVELCHRLKQEVGSYALMANTGFEHTDFLQCCKFAEGDSRILSQKLARDAFREWTEKKGRKRELPDWSREELRACDRLACLVSAATASGALKTHAWDSAWREVYALADAVCDRVMARATAPDGRAKL
jgi:hypothetical protein